MYNDSISFFFLYEYILSWIPTSFNTQEVQCLGND